MLMMLKKIFFIFCLLVLIRDFSIAQDILKRSIKWQSYEITQSQNKKIVLLGFTDATYDYSNYGYAPLYIENIPLLSSIKSNIEVELFDEKYIPLNSEEQKAIINFRNIKNVVNPSLNVINQREGSFVKVTFCPLRLNQHSGIYEKMLSFSMRLKSINNIKQEQLKSNIYAENSVLSSGKWYKIAVNKDGIYKITYQDLQKMGIDPSMINPLNIKIYGNGGGMLPEDNYTQRYDDLVENSIYVSGEDDGKFDAQDYILFYGQSPDRWTYNKSDTHFHHIKNIYTDYTYYFINVDDKKGKRISLIDNSALSATNVVSSFDDFAFHEIDAVNVMQSGKTWYGEKFDILLDYSLY
jgi:hypothetical protein